jgi:hypothetical protein
MQPQTLAEPQDCSLAATAAGGCHVVGFQASVATNDYKPATPRRQRTSPRRRLKRCNNMQCVISLLLADRGVAAR